jgi:hypothetical protein
LEDGPVGPMVYAYAVKISPDAQDRLRAAAHIDPATPYQDVETPLHRPV